ncbi:hypothetical protein BT96DRAFT_993960 [Gymnopus androsaceus JB14]|uniref:Uncharacterized protein n=1 Tax=Gymnopus androsaceus JB14 TaxID=1447944 RepID=A0A6A4HRA6_9AGAR|nr:hypothetical protein BT96DRAFT_993960 [Gymnopus androsaceus JB14]
MKTIVANRGQSWQEEDNEVVERTCNSRVMTQLSVRWSFGRKDKPTYEPAENLAAFKSDDDLAFVLCLTDRWFTGEGIDTKGANAVDDTSPFDDYGKNEKGKNLLKRVANLVAKPTQNLRLTFLKRNRILDARCPLWPYSDNDEGFSEMLELGGNDAYESVADRVLRSAQFFKLNRRIFELRQSIPGNVKGLIQRSSSRRLQPEQLKRHGECDLGFGDVGICNGFVWASDRVFTGTSLQATDSNRETSATSGSSTEESVKVAAD